MPKFNFKLMQYLVYYKLHQAQFMFRGGYGQKKI